MPKKARKSNKNLTINICISVLAIIVVAVTIFFTTRNTGQINDSYFVSDGTKYVLTVEGDTLEEGREYTPIKTHVVYDYSGDTITGMTTYIEFADESTASAALDYYKQIDQSGIENISLNGKYVVVTISEDQYSGMTASEVKGYLDFVESVQNTNSTDTDLGTTEEIYIEEEK